jgi:CRP/FNR family transcriptional regulator, cyclic AMP receptor protein
MNKTEAAAKVRAFFSQNPVHFYKKGEMVLIPGNPISDVYYVQTGLIRLYCLLGDGKELTLNIFKPGSYFPMFLILNNTPNINYFQAMTTAKLSKIPKDKIVHFIENEPDVLLDFTKRLSVGLNGLITTIQYSLFGSVHTRIISALILLSKRFGETLSDGTVVIRINLTHQDIANIVGIARETASLELEKLIKKNLITDKQRRIIIHNIPKLQKEALIDDETQIADYSL